MIRSIENRVYINKIKKEIDRLYDLLKKLGSFEVKDDDYLPPMFGEKYDATERGLEPITFFEFKKNITHPSDITSWNDENNKLNKDIDKYYKYEKTLTETLNKLEDKNDKLAGKIPGDIGEIYALDEQIRKIANQIKFNHEVLISLEAEKYEVVVDLRNEEKQLISEKASIEIQKADYENRRGLIRNTHLEGLIEGCEKDIKEKEAKIKKCEEEIKDPYYKHVTTIAYKKRKIMPEIKKSYEEIRTLLNTLMTEKLSRNAVKDLGERLYNLNQYYNKSKMAFAAQCAIEHKNPTLTGEASEHWDEMNFNNGMSVFTDNEIDGVAADVEENIVAKERQVLGTKKGRIASKVTKAGAAVLAALLIWGAGRGYTRKVDELANAKGQIDDLQNENNNLNKTNTDLNNKITDLNTQISTLTDEKADLEAKKKELEENLEKATTPEERAELDKKIKGLEEQIEGKDKALTALEEEKDKALAEKDKEITKLTSEKANLEAQVTKLEEDLENATTPEERAELDKKIKRLEEQIKEKDKQIGDLEAEKDKALAEKDKEIAELKEKNKKLTDEKESLEAQVTKLKEDLEKAPTQEEKEKLDKEIERLNGLIEENKKAFEDLEAEKDEVIKGLEKEIQDATIKIADLAAQLSQTVSPEEYAKLQEEMNKLIEDNKAKGQQIEDLQADNAALQTEIKDALALIDKLEDELNTYGQIISGDAANYLIALYRENTGKAPSSLDEIKSWLNSLIGSGYEQSPNGTPSDGVASDYEEPSYDTGNGFDTQPNGTVSGGVPGIDNSGARPTEPTENVPGLW